MIYSVFFVLLNYVLNCLIYPKKIKIIPKNIINPKKSIIFLYVYNIGNVLKAKPHKIGSNSTLLFTQQSLTHVFSASKLLTI